MIYRIIGHQLLVLLLMVLSVQTWARETDKLIPKSINEKVIVVTDRDLYLTGEKLLFSAKVFIETGNNEDELSKILYLEVFKDKKTFVQTKFRIENGHVKGKIQLPLELLSGNYYLRAYTMLMRNGQPENYFNKLIRVVNPDRKLEESSSLKQTAVKIIPEGNNFIDGIESNTVVVYNGKTYQSIKTALIVNGANDTLSEVSIYKNGIGNFSFTPHKDEDIWMKMLLDTGDSLFVKLEKPIGSGMIVRFDKERSLVEVFSKGSYRGLDIEVELYNNHFEKLNSNNLKLSEPNVSLNVNSSLFTKGVNYIVAKKSDGSILYVKPVFVQAIVSSELEYELEKTIYGKREKVSLKELGSGNNENIYYSVTKEGQHINSDGFIPKEFVFNPLLLNSSAYMISNFDDDIIKQIKLGIIINHGIFNSAEFKNKFNNTLTQKQWLPEIRDLSVSGTLYKHKTEEPIPNKMIFASVLGDQPQIHSYTTDENGNFIFSLNQLEGIKDVGLTMDSIDGMDADIVVYSDFSSRFPEFTDFPLLIDTSHKFLIKQMYVNRQISYKFKEIVLSDDVYIDTIPFPFQDVQASIVLSEFIDLPTMQEVFNEIVTYANVRKRGGHYHLNVLNKDTETLYDEPLILMDNFPIFDVDELMRIRPSLVEKIDVITKPYSFGAINFKGIVMITTKTDNFAGLRLPTETVFLRYITSMLSSQQLFPDFGDQETFKDSQPYFSNTIYWNSNLSSNKANQSFYTSDETGTYNVMITKVSEEGKIEQKSVSFIVE